MAREMTLTEDSIEQFREYLSARGRSTHTVRNYCADMNGLLKYLRSSQGPRASLIAEDETARYLNSIRTSAAATTVKRRLSAFRVYAKSQGIPVYLDEYDAPTPARPQPHPIPEGMTGVDLLLAHCQDMKEVALITLTFLCGLRISEALRITRADIDLARKTMTVNGKGSKFRVIAVSDRAIHLLEKRLAEIDASDTTTTLVDMIDRTARRRFTAIGKRAGLSRQIATHDGRHTIATHLMRNGTPMRVVQEILGHASITQTETYTGVEMDDMRAAVNF